METRSELDPTQTDASCQGRQSHEGLLSSQSRRDVTMMHEESPTITGQPTMSELQSVSLEHQNANLFLKRSHSNAKGRNSPDLGAFTHSERVSASPTVSSTLEEEAKPSSGAEIKTDLQREFTFTGYEIMDDNNIETEVALDVFSEEEMFQQANKKTYFDSCKLLGIQPVATIAQSLAESHMVLKRKGVGVKGTRALAIALVGNKYVQKIDVEDNWIGAEGALAIAQMLRVNRNLTEINIAENKIGTNGIRAIAELLSENETLRKLDISGSDLSDQDAKYVAKILESNYKLKELRVRHNNFGELGGLYLGPAIASNDTLEVLDLAWNHLRRRGAVSVATGLKGNGGLRVFNISWNGFALDSCMILGQSLKDNTMLRELDISHNRLDTAAMGGILKGVQGNETLTTLRLGGNAITPEVATIILRTIARSYKSAIQNLDLQNIAVHEEFHILLKEVQASRLIECKTGPVMKKGQSKVKAEVKPQNDPMQKHNGKTEGEDSFRSL